MTREDASGGGGARVLTRAEVVQRTSLSLSTLERMERDGRFPPRIRLTGRRTGWLEADVDAWLESRRQPRD